MATISTAKNAFFNLARSQNHPSFCLPSSARKASRVCFTTSASSSKAQHNEAGDNKKKANEAKETVKQNVEKTKEKAQESKERAKERAEETKEKTKGAAESLGDKAKQTVQEAWGAAKETTQKIKETVVGNKKEEDDDKYQKSIDESVEDHLRKRGGDKKD